MRLNSFKNSLYYPLINYEMIMIFPPVLFIFTFSHDEITELSESVTKFCVTTQKTMAGSERRNYCTNTFSIL
jgi:hypothetical protein